MATAEWNGAVIAQSDDTIIVEGNHYFPRESVNPGVLDASTKTTVCSWKGTANYFSIVVDGRRNEDAAWYYATPTDAAREISGRVAFGKASSLRRSESWWHTRNFL